MPYLSSRPLGGLGPRKFRLPAWGWKLTGRAVNQNKPEQLLMARDVGSDGTEGPGVPPAPLPSSCVQ